MASHDLFVFFLALATVLHLADTRLCSSNYIIEPKLCTSKVCKEVAKQIITSLNTSADPCEDFSEFACGGWIQEQTELFPNLNSVLYAERMRFETNQFFIDIIQQYEPEPNDPKVFSTIQRYFNSCMEQDYRENSTLLTVKKLIFSDLGSIISTNQFNEQKRSLTNLLDGIVDLYSGEPLFRLQMYFEPRGILLGIDLPKRQSDEWRTRAAFQLLENNTLTSEENLKEEEEIRKWISEFDKIQTPLNATNFTILNMQRQFSLFNWSTLFADLPEETEIVVKSPLYFQQLQTLVEKSDPRIVHNAILVLVARDLGLKFFAAPAKSNSMLKSFCIGNIDHHLILPLSSFLSHYLNKLPELVETRIKAQELFSELKKSVVNMIEDSNWYDDISRKQILLKLKKQRVHFLFEQNSTLSHQSYLDKIATIVDEADERNFIMTKWRLQRSYKDFCILNFLKPASEYENTFLGLFFAYPLNANAHHLHDFNSIALPWALTNSSVFSLNTPWYLGLGSLGFIMAHEIVHSFDSLGKNFNEFGNKSPLLSQDSEQRFQEKYSCIEQQFSNVFQTNLSLNDGSTVLLKVNGNLSMSENLADLGAIKTILATHKRLVKEKDLESLPGLTHLSHEQIMLIQAAQYFCAKMSPDLFYRHSQSEYPPYPHRINGIMINSPEFGRIFNCPTGSRLNPIQKCSIW